MTSFAISTTSALLGAESYRQIEYVTDAVSLAKKMIPAFFVLSLTGTGTGVYADSTSDLALLENAATSNLHLRVVGGTDSQAPQTSTVQSAPELVNDVQSHLGLNVSQIAEIVGVSRPTIYNWKKGKEEPNEANIARLMRLKKLIEGVPSDYATYLGKFLKRTLPSGQTLAEILSDPASNADALAHGYEMLKPAIVNAVNKRQRLQEPPAAHTGLQHDLSSALEGRDYPGA
jgi:DNA-binding XRE family transcriptional regulator